LCLYYIASTLWGIAERKLLPKLQHVDTSTTTAQDAKTDESTERKSRKSDDASDRKGRGQDGKGNGRDARSTRGRGTPTLIDRLQELLKKAEKR
jgi:hypothetical protein